MKKLKIIYTIVTCISFLGVFAQAPDLDWQITYGGSEFDAATDLVSTSDGGYLIAGHSESNDGDLNSNNGDSDIWLLKTDASGEILWQKVIGGNGYDVINKITKTADNGFILVGTTASDDGDFSNNNGNYDVLIIKLDANGDVQWLKNYGGSGYETGRDIIQTTDGGYLFIADSDSVDGDLTENLGSSDFWVVKINSAGTIEWQRNYGGSDHDLPYAILQNTVGNYMIGGYTFSNDQDVTGNHGERDIWLIHLTPTGSLLSTRIFGGSSNDSLKDMKLTTDGGYMLAGNTTSQDGDVTENAGLSDAWIIKLDEDGEIIWQKTFGGSLSDDFSSIEINDQGEFIAVGNSNSTDGDLSSNNGLYDIWMVKGESTGEIIWEKSFGGTDRDYPGGFILTSDGSFTIAGRTRSSDGDVTSNNGDYDLWLLKIEAEQMATENFDDFKIQIYPNPAEDFVQINSKKPIQTIVLHDNSGKKLMQINSQKANESISINHLPTGVYLIKIEIDGKWYTKKILKK